MSIRYLHTMVRVTDLDQSLDFYCNKLGLEEVRRIDRPQGRYTLVFLAAPPDREAALENRTAMMELTYNWPPENGQGEVYAGGRNFGHLAYEVEDLYALCAKLQAAGITINRPPRDGHMAFVRSPDGISIELIQKKPDLAPAEPWLSMPNTGAW